MDKIKNDLETEKKIQKKEYNVPTLQEIGKVRDLTKGLIGVDFDSNTNTNDGAS